MPKYFAYPKLKNKINSRGIHRDDIFPYLEVNDTLGFVPGTHLKFNKMISLDDNYTIIGLKQIKKKSSTNKPS